MSQEINLLEPLITYGSVHEEIIQTAKHDKARLIILSSSQKDNKNKSKLGEIAEQIIRKSDSPVWTVKQDSKIIPRQILCPVDFSPHSQRALASAISLSRNFNAKLTILAVYEPVPYASQRIGADLKEENAMRLARTQMEVDSLIRNFDIRNLTHQVTITSGKPAEKILEIAEEQSIDLLLMGTAGRSGLSRIFMGSITEQVIAQIPCSFVTLKKSDKGIDVPNRKLSEIEKHYKIAGHYAKSGQMAQAIEEYNKCLHLNDMYIPALKKLIEIHAAQGQEEKANQYRNIIRKILNPVSGEEIIAEL